MGAPAFEIEGGPGEDRNHGAAGETYEVCLTNMLSLTAEVEPLATYRTLRRLSPTHLSFR